LIADSITKAYSKFGQYCIAHIPQNTFDLAWRYHYLAELRTASCQAVYLGVGGETSSVACSSSLLQFIDTCSTQHTWEVSTGDFGYIDPQIHGTLISTAAPHYQLIRATHPVEIDRVVSSSR
jgi:hypothetical protein